MQQLARDLRFYCAFIVLPAVVLAVGGVLLQHLDFADQHGWRAVTGP